LPVTSALDDSKKPSPAMVTTERSAVVDLQLLGLDLRPQQHCQPRLRRHRWRRCRQRRAGAFTSMACNWLKMPLVRLFR
jgi:hypothetical protein